LSKRGQHETLATKVMLPTLGLFLTDDYTYWYWAPV
jgi:hypothetical protein